MAIILMRGAWPIWRTCSQRYEMAESCSWMTCATPVFKLWSESPEIFASATPFKCNITLSITVWARLVCSTMEAINMMLGFGMNGMEERILTLARAIAVKFNEVTYVEIGVAEGTTLTAIGSILRDHAKKWRAIGIELPN